MTALLRRLLPPAVRHAIMRLGRRFWLFVCRHLPLRSRVLFYTIRADDRLLENAQAVYDLVDGKKVVFAHKLPHSIRENVLACYYLLTSRVIVTDDYVRYLRLFRLRKGQRLLQIWHACGAFKKFALDAPSLLTPAQERATHAQYTAVAVTAEACRAPYAGAFGIPVDRCLPIGLPRTDSLLTERDALCTAFRQKYPQLAGRTLYLFCPTFRERDGARVAYDPGIDWQALSKALRPEEMLIVCRHPLMTEPLLDGKYPNLIDLTREPTSMLLAACDVLITDYSSVFYDACLLDVPTVFYCPDLAEYARGFYLRFPEDLPGPLVTAPDALLQTLRQTKSDPPTERIAAFRAAWLSACDGHAAERAAAIVNEWLS
ncbi:MAG: CDP-glycerol glycerophosphotransferase family protein [Clostridia bacterium]|nr:CDP-glycerol glycerophosphotransferase family protein [Clostridia bacterium]